MGTDTNWGLLYRENATNVSDLRHSQRKTLRNNIHNV